MMKKLRVLFISHSDPGNGGAPKSLMELVFNLKTNFNVEPVVCVYSKDMVYKFCQNNDIECYVTAHKDIWTGGIKSPAAWFILPKYRKRLKLSNRRAFDLLNRKVDMNSIDLIHSNVSVVGLGMYINEVTNIPHIMHLREDADVLNKMVYAINPIKNMNKNVTRFIAISDFVKKKWCNKGLSSSRVDLIYNGLNLPSMQPRRILNNNSIKIVVVGSIIRSKGQLLVVKAIQNLEKCYRDKISLDIIGTGNKRYIQKIKKVLEEHKLTNVHLLGYQNDISSKLKNYDIGIMASQGEAFGRVTVEYMANGLVVVANNTGANPEIITNNKTGLLFNKNDIASLSQNIQYLIKNPDMANELSKKGQEEVYRRFTTNINTKNIYNEYKKLLKNKSKLEGNM